LGRRVALKVRAADGDDGRTPDAGRRVSWDIGRFLRTVTTFNPAPSPDKVIQSLAESVFGPPPPSPSPLIRVKSGVADDSTEVVLVVGATGGVGKRVVERLVRRGRNVRAMVRDVPKARALFSQLSGPGTLDLAPADIAQPATLLPEFFENVKQVVHCAAVTVVPKEGDTPAREKYYQGIKFYEPEIKGDTPEAVEFRAVQSILEAASPSVGLKTGKLLLGYDAAREGALVGADAWAPLDDVVMGGASESCFVVSAQEKNLDPRDDENEPRACGVFSGNVTTANSGGFASVRTKNYDPKLDLSMYDGFSLHLFGNGLRYKFIVRTEPGWDSVAYCLSFDTVADQWQTVKLPFRDFAPVFRANTVKNGPSMDAGSIFSMQLMLSKFEYDNQLNPSFRAGRFSVPIADIRSYVDEAHMRPRVVHLSTAGVTRWNRPGLDLNNEPPAVRMNEELGGILTYKLMGEDVVRESGLAYTVVRPVALTEEPAGAPLQFGQGDTIKGKISRDDVADICVAALDEPAALDVTFEVKSTIPFSETWEGIPDKSTDEPVRSFAAEFSALKTGVTGKTEDGVYTVHVEDENM